VVVAQSKEIQALVLVSDVPFVLLDKRGMTTLHDPTVIIAQVYEYINAHHSSHANELYDRIFRTKDPGDVCCHRRNN
jgi:hypothetical protein